MKAALGVIVAGVLTVSVHAESTSNKSHGMNRTSKARVFKAHGFNKEGPSLQAGTGGVKNPATMKDPVIKPFRQTVSYESKVGRESKRYAYSGAPVGKKLSAYGSTGKAGKKLKAYGSTARVGKDTSTYGSAKGYQNTYRPGYQSR